MSRKLKRSGSSLLRAIWPGEPFVQQEGGERVCQMQMCLIKPKTEEGGKYICLWVVVFFYQMYLNKSH